MGGQTGPFCVNQVTHDLVPVHDLTGGNTWVPGLLQNTQWRLHSAENATYLNATILAARQMLQKAATMSITLSISGT